MKNQKFIIQPHFRLQEWVADEKGYFADEGLEYVFEETVRSTDGKSHDKDGQKSGAYQTFEKGRTSDVNCACHWTVNVAASNGHGKLWADVYSVAPAGIFVPHDSPIRAISRGATIRASRRSSSTYPDYLAEQLGYRKINSSEGLIICPLILTSVFNSTKLASTVSKSREIELRHSYDRGS